PRQLPAEGPWSRCRSLPCKRIALHSGNELAGQAPAAAFQRMVRLPWIGGEMKQAEWQRSQQARVESLLSGVPFFNEVSRDDADQRALLLAGTRILEAAPGEVVI